MLGDGHWHKRGVGAWRTGDDEIMAEDVAAFSLALSRLFSEGALYAGHHHGLARPRAVKWAPESELRLPPARSVHEFSFTAHSSANPKRFLCA